MNSITQDIKYRLSILSYAEKNGVTKAAIKYRTNRQFIYRLRQRYDGTPQSLAPKSRRPHSHPNQHTENEITLIKNMHRRNSHDGLVVFWVKLQRRGYHRSIAGLFRCMRRLGLRASKLENPKKKYKPKPYQAALFPGEKVQIDVKVVPKSCIAGQFCEEGGHLYQYTAIDECTRFRYLCAFEEQNTYSSTIFLQKLVKYFPFPICKIQTDNGTEFTKTFTKEDSLTLFEQQLKAYGIEHQKIRPYTPRHNGKVERSHRKDNEYFYARRKFYSLQDFEKQLRAYNRQYNAFPMRPLGWKSPRQVIDSFLQTL